MKLYRLKRGQHILGKIKTITRASACLYWSRVIITLQLMVLYLFRQCLPGARRLLVVVERKWHCETFRESERMVSAGHSYR
ncbi:hypothetical protein OH77DRAFT_4948 [Trametes cingulata]|nr:hypothetical protein OH77DRAFT_4948 [Trametes cingulata]